MLFSALHMYSPMSAFVTLASFRQAVPLENSILQVGEDRTLPSALNHDTLISGVPSIWHFRHTASPTVTSIGSKRSIKKGGSKGDKYICLRHEDKHAHSHFVSQNVQYIEPNNKPKMDTAASQASCPASLETSQVYFPAASLSLFRHSRMQELSVVVTLYL